MQQRNRFAQILVVLIFLCAATANAQSTAGHSFISGSRYPQLSQPSPIVGRGPQAYEVPPRILDTSPAVVSSEVPVFIQPSIGLDSNLSIPMLSLTNRQTDKELLLLSPGESVLQTPSITIGAQFRASAMVANTNTTDKFSYLGRFPTDFVGNSATDARMLQANQMIVGHFSPWAHGYMETLFSDVFTFPAFNQGSFQVRQAYVAFGNLSESPLYAFLGKKTVNFGDMGTLNPFSQAMPWHYFAPLAEGVGVGFSLEGFNASVTALNGSRGIRVSDSEEKGHLNNFAANLHYEIPLADDVVWAIGGGYLHGTIYDGSVAEHINPAITGPRNGAWDVNSSLRLGAWQFQGELVRTEKDWPVTGAEVTAWRAELAYGLEMNSRPLQISGGWSEGLQGQTGSEFEFNRQLVAGVRYDVHPNVMLSFEYVRSLGFAPLINITTVSDRDVIQDSFVLGVVLAI